MSRPNKTLAEYHELAQKKGLRYLEIFPARSVSNTVRWHCDVCNTTLYKSYHTLAYQRYPCRCRNGVSLDVAAYVSLAEQLGITFVHATKPHNIFEAVKWATPDGEILEASYRDLKYTNLLQRLQEDEEVVE